MQEENWDGKNIYRRQETDTSMGRLTGMCRPLHAFSNSFSNFICIDPPQSKSPHGQGTVQSLISYYFSV
jgi:hypothetical protein